MRAKGKNPEEMMQREVCTGINGEISYITVHMFYEDLAKIQDSLPPLNILEELNSKDDDDANELNMEHHMSQITQQNAKDYVH